MTDFLGARWRKSSRSNDQGLCVEVADDLVGLTGLVGLRDAKNPAGPVLAVRAAGWIAFVAATKSGAFGPA